MVGNDDNASRAGNLASMTENICEDIGIGLLLGVPFVIFLFYALI